MANQILPAFPQFFLHEDHSSVGVRWKKWLQRFENFLLSMDINDDMRKRAMLLHYAGDEVQDLFHTI